MTVEFHKVGKSQGATSGSQGSTSEAQRGCGGTTPRGQVRVGGLASNSLHPPGTTALLSVPPELEGLGSVIKESPRRHLRSVGHCLQECTGRTTALSE